MEAALSKAFQRVRDEFLLSGTFFPESSTPELFGFWAQHLWFPIGNAKVTLLFLFVAGNMSYLFPTCRALGKSGGIEIANLLVERRFA